MSSPIIPELQLSILNFLLGDYPARSEIVTQQGQVRAFWDKIDPYLMLANFAYMKEKRWVIVSFDHEMTGSNLPTDAKITAKGIDYLTKISGKPKG